MSFKKLNKELAKLAFAPDPNAIEPDYKCSICKDTEQVTINKQQLDEYWEWCDACHWKNEIIRELRKSGISKKQMDMKLKDFDTESEHSDVQKFREDMKRKARTFVERPGGLFFASGLTGGGKTLISTITAKNVASQTKGFRYCKWSDEMNRVREDYNKRPEPLKWKNFLNVEVLYIDDFLKTKKAIRYGENDSDYYVLRDVPEYEYDLSFELINHRCENSLVTIISTEWFLSEIEQLNEALFGRLVEMIRKGGMSIEVPRDERYNYRLNGKFKEDKNE